MGLFKSLISLLIARMLFLQISNLYTNGEISVMSVLNYNKSSAHHIPIEKSPCVKIISYDHSALIPKIQTYNLPLQSLEFREQWRERKRYRSAFTTTLACCEGYIQVDTFCEPHCQSCKKGYCTGPNVCTCHAGYRASNDTNDKEMCVPVCTNGCINGTCVEPDICSCNEDYWLDSDGFTCRPVCDEECERNNGYCNEPHVCSCRSGYKKSRNFTSFMCEPICDRECKNGFCVAPNVCKCLDDYEQQDDRFTCLPKCNRTCVFGTCVAPQTCKCNDGYRYRDESTKYICEPICEMDCSNGTCVRPGVCVCDKGFVYDNQTDPVCKPHCTVPCGPHEKCTSPNTCTCSEGYRYNNASFPLRNESLCEPICERGCQNGDCVGPNYCICHDHFVPNFESNFEAECIPKCSRNCSHGACFIEDNEYRCKCHYGWTGGDCDQPTLCITIMDFNSSDINRITIRNDTNSTIIQVYKNAPYCQCNNSLNKKSLCYMIHSDKGNTTPIISCLSSTDLPCYLTSVPHYSASINAEAKTVWPFMAIAILIATILITVAYLMYRRYEKKKLIIDMPKNLLVRNSIATESLLSENVVDF